MRCLIMTTVEVDEPRAMQTSRSASEEISSNPRSLLLVVLWICGLLSPGDRTFGCVMALNIPLMELRFYREAGTPFFS